MNDSSSQPTQFRCWLSHLALKLGLLFVCAGPGCHSWQKSHEAAIAHFGSGDLSSSRTSLAESQKVYRSEKQMLELEQGILDLAAGDVAQSETRFRTLRRELEHLEQKDVAEQTTSLLTDSRAVAYSGRDFERRMILNMAMLTSIMGDGQDATAYSIQIAEAAFKRREAIAAAMKKLPDSNEIALESQDGQLPSQFSPAGFSSSQSIASTPLDRTLALGSYLAAAVQSEHSSRYQETEQAIEDVQFWNPGFRCFDGVNAPAEFGTRCQPGHGTLHVITLVGKAPRWVSESAAPTSAALLIADRIISITGKHTLPPTIASVKIARPELCGNIVPLGGVQCTVGPPGANESQSMPPLTFSTLVNLNEVAEASYREHRDQEIGAVVARRVLKKGAVYVLKETQKIHNNSLVDLGVNVAGVAWEALEKPDTRSWRMLPARIDVARAELPAGPWTTSLQFASYGVPRSRQEVPVHIADGRNTYVLCIIPEHDFTGHILIGGADSATIPLQ